MCADMLRVAIPNKGVMHGRSVELLTAAGYSCVPIGGQLVAEDHRNGVEFLYVRSRDIAGVVADAVVDLGVSGQDFVVDAQVAVDEVLALDFAHSTIHYAVAAGSPITVDRLEGRRIATALPGLVAADLARRGVEATIVALEGAVEGAIRLGVADVVVDIVDSGRTLRAQGLVVIGPPIMTSVAVLIAPPRPARDPRTTELAERVAAVLDTPHLSVKTFEGLFDELATKVATADPTSGTVAAVAAGPHAVGKKLVEEAAESWMAAEHEGPDRTAEELAQLLYHAQVMMLACGLRPADVYRHL